jgi:hypothetical protein
VVRETGRRAQRRTNEKQLAGRTARQYARLLTGLRSQVEDLYRQLDAQLTRMAEIQLAFDGLRSKLRNL